MQLKTTNKHPSDIKVRKSSEVGEVITNEEPRTLTFTITSDSVDRDEDKIDINGWNLEYYLKSPVVLWSHDDSSLPIGKVVDIQRSDNKLKAKVEFADKELNPFAEQVYQLAKSGFLNATSVGFKPIEYDMTSEPERSKGYLPGIDYKKQELMELSIVNVGSNRDALIEPSKSVELPIKTKPTDKEKNAAIALSIIALSKRSLNIQTTTSRP